MKCIALGGRPLDPENLIDWRGVMNDPEVTMNDTPSNRNLIVYTKAVEAAAIVLAIARRVPAPLKSVADQAIRSATSVPANLAEGHGRTGRDRLHHWRIAFASAKEIDCHLRLLVGSGAVDPGQASRSIGLFDEVRAMTWRLLHPAP